MVATLLAAMLATTGCAQLPKSGEIKSGPNVESGLETDYLYYSPSGPTDGDSQEEIVLGFLNAGTGPQNDFEVAKSYLSNIFRTNPAQVYSLNRQCNVYLLDNQN